MAPSLSGEALAQDCNIKTVKIYPYVEDNRITVNFAYNKDWTGCTLHGVCTLNTANYPEIRVPAELRDSYQAIAIDIPPCIKKRSDAGIRCVLTDDNAGTWKVSGSIKLPGTSRMPEDGYQPTQEKNEASIPGKAVIRKDNGVYITIARINGSKVPCLIDTGATIVTMSRKQARELHLRYDRTREVPVITASGLHSAYSAKLSSVAVGSVVVRNVRALISSNDYPPVILLGMSFLEHVHVSMKKDKIILEK